MATSNEKNDAVKESALNKNEVFFMKNKNTIIIAIVAIIVIVAGSLWYKDHSSEKNIEASTAIAKSQEYFANQQFDKALNGDGAGSTGFVKVANDYSGTDAGNLANLYAGLCYANMNKWKEAAQYLENYSPADDEMVSPAAVAALGDAYAHLNQLDKAVESFKKAAKLADSKAEGDVNNSISPYALIKAGEILESQNKKDEALQIYNDIKKKYVNSPASQEIDKYIERVTTK